MIATSNEKCIKLQTKKENLGILDGLGRYDMFNIIHNAYVLISLNKGETSFYRVSWYYKRPQHGNKRFCLYQYMYVFIGSYLALYVKSIQIRVQKVSVISPQRLGYTSIDD